MAKATRASPSTIPSDYMRAEEALAALEIKTQTLYAYVSRGWIRSVHLPGTHRKLYLRDDVTKVRARSRARAGHGPAAASAMRWGEPVIYSSITEITPQGPRYRGRLAAELAGTRAAFEATAGLLWSGVWDETCTGWPLASVGSHFQRAADQLASNFTPLRFREHLSLLVQLVAAAQPQQSDASTGTTIPASRQLLQALAGAFAYLSGRRYVAPRPGERLSRILLRAMDSNLGEADCTKIDGLLTLCADHELAPSTFAARIAASTGADVYASVLSGIAAFGGPLTGLGADVTEDIVGKAPTRLGLRKAYRALRERGKSPPGFNHPLYPRGDPRALFLLNEVKGARRIPPAAGALLDFVDEIAKDGHTPGLPVGLVALALLLELPPRAASALFLLARIAGWIAHVQEQRMAGFLLRPRAKYLPM